MPEQRHIDQEKHLTCLDPQNFGVMSNYYHIDPSTPLSDRLFDPLRQASADAPSRRRCHSLPDEEWIQIGVRRVLATESSGRGFLHLLEDQHERHVSPSLFFESLMSARRGRYAHEVAASVHRQARTVCTDHDPFTDVASLAGYDIYAGDGHFIEHACHDQPIDRSVFATGGFFAADLRSHALHLLTIAERGGTRKREHDMRALKRLGTDALRGDAPVGRKVIWVWDRAGIDATWWQHIKSTSGVYFVSRTKENIRLDVLGELDYDASDPLNDGVTAFQLVSLASQSLRCVRYRCPQTGLEMDFITSLTQIEPGVIAALYRSRWDIEKIFDETKRKLRESKSWASSTTAKTIHAELICLAHNLLLLLEHRLEHEHGISNHRDAERRHKRWAQVAATPEGIDARPSPLVRRLWLRGTQRTLAFIRWVQNNIDTRVPWERLLARLRRRYGVA